MISSKKIDKEIKENFLNKMASPKSVSHPVIRYEEGAYWLAVFAFFFTKEEVKNGMIPRPEYYGLADLETGKIRAVRKCRTKDFSNASFDRKYSIDMTGMEKPTEDFLDKAFEYLDEARQILIETREDAFLQPYKKYFDAMTANIPSEYRRFYKDLSKPYKEEKKEIFDYSQFDEPQNGKERKRRRDQSEGTPPTKEEAMKKIFGSKAEGNEVKPKAPKEDKDIKEVKEENKPAKKNTDKTPAEKQKKEEPKNEEPQKEKLKKEEPKKEEPKKEEPIKRISEKDISFEPVEEATVEINKEENEETDDLDETIAVNEEAMKKLIEDIQTPREKRPNLFEALKHSVFEKKEKEYTWKDLNWIPKEDLSILPDRYFSIAERIADSIDFLPCDTPMLRFAYPLFCFKEDMSPGDPWQIMQMKVLNSDVQKAHYRTKATDAIYTSCVNKNKCIFHTCPYVIAAYIKYLKLKNRKELERQREIYKKNKISCDTEEVLYEIHQPNEMPDKEIEEARKFIDSGKFNIARKAGTADVFMVTYVSDEDGTPSKNDMSFVTSFGISKEEIENGFEKGFLKRLNGKHTPDGVDILIWTDYLIKTGKIEPEEDDDMVTIHF